MLGGGLIGLSAVILMAFNGRIAGATGIASGIVPPLPPDWRWRLAFIAGAVVAPALIVVLGGRPIPFQSTIPTPWLVVGGLIVGVGAYFGNGCPSGHGVCGISRLSPRSIVATLTFMATAIATVFVVRHLVGGL
nr:YeeE/YedE thiosulfate transporter family protein [Pelagibacterium limicola]